MPSSHLILGRPLLLLPSIPPSIRVFSNESTLHMRWPKSGVSALHHSFQRNPRLDLLQTDWLHLLAVQGTLKSLLQDHSSKASILWRSAFFMVQLSHPYMTTEKNHSFVGKGMSLLFNMLSRFVRAFLQRSKHLLILWLQSSSAVIFMVAAKSLQSCPTLCDAIDSSPPGSLFPGILQARTLEWVAISFSNA